MEKSVTLRGAARNSLNFDETGREKKQPTALCCKMSRIPQKHFQMQLLTVLRHLPVHSPSGVEVTPCRPCCSCRNSVPQPRCHSNKRYLCFFCSYSFCRLPLNPQIISSNSPSLPTTNRPSSYNSDANNSSSNSYANSRRSSSSSSLALAGSSACRWLPKPCRSEEALRIALEAAVWAVRAHCSNSNRNY